MSHTPGPWTISRTNDSGVVFINAPDWAEFARISVLICEEHLLEGKANANLIAAAPDLLEALKMALAFMGAPTFAGDIPVFEQMQAAIAKAERKCIFRGIR